MKVVAVIAVAVLVSALPSSCFAMSCNCEDWTQKGGYCVDYVKDRIPAFPLPYKEDMPSLKNTEVGNVTEGDVAVFRIKNYWHVAYVEKVHRNLKGEASAIDVSEMNFGDELSFPEFKATWKSSSQHDWNRALCCGVTDNYDRVTWRRNVALATVEQVWSPDDVPTDGGARRGVKAVVGKIKEVVNRFMEYAEGAL